MEINRTPNVFNLNCIRMCDEKIEIDGLLYDAEELSDLTHKVCKMFANQVPMLISFYEKIEDCLLSAKIYNCSDGLLWYDVTCLVVAHRKIQECFNSLLEINAKFTYSQRISFVRKYGFAPLIKLMKLIALQDVLIITENPKNVVKSVEAIYATTLAVLIEESPGLRIDLIRKICSNLLQVTSSADAKEVPYTETGYHLFHYAACIGSKAYVKLGKIFFKEKRNILEPLLNGLSSKGLSPLEIALSCKQSKFAIALMKAGANYMTENACFQTPLHLAAIHNDFEAIDYLLQQSQVVHLLDKQDVYARTYRDYFLKTDLLPPSIEQSVILERIERYLLIIYEREQKKLELEKIKYNQEVDRSSLKSWKSDQDATFDFLSGISEQCLWQGTSEGKNFDAEPTQSKTNFSHTIGIYEKKQKILKSTYLEITQGNCFGTKDGACNGFVILFGYYAFRGLTEEFFRILESISAWDGQEKSLQQSIIHEKFSGMYSTLEELLEYWSNYVIWFQANYKEIRIGNGSLENWQNNRCEQFDFVKKSPLFHLDCLFSLKLHLTMEQLDEILMVFSYLPDLYMDIGGENHVVAPYIHSDCKVTYYEPNLKFRTRVLNSQETAKIIQNLKYRALGKKWERMKIHLYGYRFSEEGSKIIYESKIPKELLENKSIQNLNPLYLAIIFNDIELLLEELEKNPTLVNKRGILGTPLELCDAWKRLKMFETIMRHKSFDPVEDVHTGIWRRVRQMGFLDIYKLALKNEAVVISQLEFFSLIRDGNVELVDLFLSVPTRKKFVNKRYIETPLVVAIYQENLEMIKCLIKHGADFNAEGFEDTGLSALKLMARLRKKELIRGLLQYLDEVNLQDVKKSIENAIEKYADRI